MLFSEAMLKARRISSTTVLYRALPLNGGAYRCTPGGRGSVHDEGKQRRRQSSSERDADRLST